MHPHALHRTTPHRTAVPLTIMHAVATPGVTSVFNVTNVNADKFEKYTEQNKKTYADWNDDETGTSQAERCAYHTNTMPL